MCTIFFKTPWRQQSLGKGTAMKKQKSSNGAEETETTRTTKPITSLRIIASQAVAVEVNRDANKWVPLLEKVPSECLQCIFQASQISGYEVTHATRSADHLLAQCLDKLRHSSRVLRRELDARIFMMALLQHEEAYHYKHVSYYDYYYTDAKREKEREEMILRKQEKKLRQPKIELISVYGDNSRHTFVYEDPQVSERGIKKKK